MSYPIITINAEEYKNVYGFFFNAEPNDEVIDLLVNAYTMDKRIRLFYGDIETGKCWNEENDVIGYIGRSTGSIRIPLMIHNKNSSGGSGILEHCIIGIQLDN